MGGLRLLHDSASLALLWTPMEERGEGAAWGVGGGERTGGRARRAKSNGVGPSLLDHVYFVNPCCTMT